MQNNFNQKQLPRKTYVGVPSLTRPIWHAPSHTQSVPCPSPSEGGQHAVWSPSLEKEGEGEWRMRVMCQNEKSIILVTDVS